MSPADLAALWDEAKATLGPDSKIELELLRLARDGRRNARILIDNFVTDATECPCGEDLCEWRETPERNKRREVFTRLAKALEEASTGPVLELHGVTVMSRDDAIAPGETRETIDLQPMTIKRVR